MVLAVAPAVVATLALVGHHRQDFGTGVWLGVLMAAVSIGVAWARSIAFESRHPDESAGFWLAREAVIRPRMFFVSLALSGLGLVLFVLALIGGSAFVTGVSIAPTYTALGVVLLMWGKVP